MKPLTQKDALKIAKKLGATIQSGKKHDQVIVKHMDKFIARFGISRASKEKNHNYIPGQLKVLRTEARKLADCQMSQNDYFSSLHSRGIVSLEAKNGTNITKR